MYDATERALFAAEAAAVKTRKRALDPIAMPDAKAARTSVETAEFTIDRLNSLLPPIERKHRDVAATEYAAQWEVKSEQTRGQRDQAAAALRNYPALAAKLVGLFQKAAEADKEVSRVNGSAPFGEERRLEGVEATARAGLELRWTIAAELKVPSFEKPNEVLWPPWQPSLAGLCASMMPVDNFRSREMVGRRRGAHRRTPRRKSARIGILPAPGSRA